MSNQQTYWASAQLPLWQSRQTSNPQQQNAPSIMGNHCGGYQFNAPVRDVDCAPFSRPHLRNDPSPQDQMSDQDYDDMMDGMGQAYWNK